MSEHPHAPETEPRVPRTINGITDALNGARRMEFYRAAGHADGRGPAAPTRRRRRDAR